MNMPKRYSLSLPPSRRVRHRRSLLSFVYRVVLLGNKNVGKTSLIKRYVTGEYTDEYIPTVSDMYEKTVTRDNDIAFYTLRMYDTAGGMKYEFPAMYRMTVSQGDIFILIYSVDNRESFLELSKLWKDIKELKGKENEDLPAVVVGNKMDIRNSKRQVSEEEGQKFADEIDCAFIEVSAVADINIDNIFQNLLSELEMLQLDTPPQSVSLARRMSRGLSSLKADSSQGDKLRIPGKTERPKSFTLPVATSGALSAEVKSKPSLSKIKKHRKLLGKHQCVVM